MSDTTPPLPSPASTKRAGLSRRTVLKGIAGTLGIAGLGAAGYFATRDAISVGVIGCGGRGGELARISKLTGYYAHRYLKVNAVADANLVNAEALRAQHASGAEVHQDYRRLLDRKDIEAVLIATTDHQHVPVALAALKAGKAVYLEKPMAHTIIEGRKLVEAVAQTGQVLLVGMQQRSDAHFRTACELVRQGRLGKLKKVIVTLAGKGGQGGPFDTKPVPSGLDLNAWLGPAPEVPYCPERHKGWHDWFDYGGGEMTNWGVHHLDIVQWAVDACTSGPLWIESTPVMPTIQNGYQFPVMFTAKLTYPNDVVVEIKTNENNAPPETNNGIEFIGENGTLFVNRSTISGMPYDGLAQNPLPASASLHPSPAAWVRTTVRHLDHFANCVRQLEQPIADAETGHRSASVCNLVIIAQRLGRKLQWNPVAEQFVNDKEANEYCDKPRRMPL